MIFLLLFLHCKDSKTHTHTGTHIHTYTHTYIQHDSHVNCRFLDLSLVVLLDREDIPTILHLLTLLIQRADEKKCNLGVCEKRNTEINTATTHLISITLGLCVLIAGDHNGETKLTSADVIHNVTVLVTRAWFREFRDLDASLLEERGRTGCGVDLVSKLKKRTCVRVFIHNRVRLMFE